MKQEGAEREDKEACAASASKVSHKLEEKVPTVGEGSAKLGKSGLKQVSRTEAL